MWQQGRFVAATCAAMQDSHGFGSCITPCYCAVALRAEGNNKKQHDGPVKGSIEGNLPAAAIDRLHYMVRCRDTRGSARSCVSRGGKRKCVTLLISH